MPNYNDVISFKALYKSAKESCKNVTWKASTQMFEMQILLWVGRLRRQLLKGIYKSKGFNEFDIMERGKLRHIQSVHISERTVQKSLCNNGIKPIIEPLLIDTNTASRKGMGTSKARKDLKQHLTEHYKEHGTNGGILVMDLHDYFHSIDHEILKEKYRAVIADERILKLLFYFIDCFNKGLGLGSEISQISAIFYANDIDHFIADKGLKYARYMDDSYVISPDIEELRTLRNEIERKYSEIGIAMNKSKTQIIPFAKSSFSYLKRRWRIHSDGKITERPTRDIFVKERRKLKKYRKMLDNGQIQMKSIRNSYNSWRGGIKDADCGSALYKTDQLYFKLFDEKYTGERIEDIEFRKNFQTLYEKYKKGNIKIYELKRLYHVWKDNIEWRAGCKSVILKINKFVRELLKDYIKNWRWWHDPGGYQGI